MDKKCKPGMRVLWDTRGKCWSGASGLDLVPTSDPLPGFEIDLSEALSLPKFKFLNYQSHLKPGHLKINVT